MLMINGHKANGFLDCDGPFITVDEAIAWADTHDYADYVIEPEEDWAPDGEDDDYPFDDDWYLDDFDEAA